MHNIKRCNLQNQLHKVYRGSKIGEFLYVCDGSLFFISLA